MAFLLSLFTDAQLRWWVLLVPATENVTTAVAVVWGCLLLDACLLAFVVRELGSIDLGLFRDVVGGAVHLLFCLAEHTFLQSVAIGLHHLIFGEDSSLDAVFSHVAELLLKAYQQGLGDLLPILDLEQLLDDSGCFMVHLAHSFLLDQLGLHEVAGWSLDILLEVIN